MVFDLDLFQEMLPETAGVNARAGAKFQPKAKPRARKETIPTVPSILPNITEEKSVTTASNDCSHSVVTPTTILVNSALTDSPSKPPESRESINSIEVLHSVEVSPHHVMTRETADIFSDLESLDNILSQSTTTNASTVRKFQPKVKMNCGPRNKLPTSRPVTTDTESSFSHPKDLEEGHSLPTLSSIGPSTLMACNSPPTDNSPEHLLSKVPVNSMVDGTFDYNGDLLMDNGRLEREESEAFPGLESLNLISQATATTTGESRLIPPETEYLDDNLTPAFPPDGFFDFETMRLSDSAPTDPPSEFLVTDELTHVDVPDSNAAIPEEVVDSPIVPIMPRKESTKLRKRKSSTASEDTVNKVRSKNVDLCQGSQDKIPISSSGDANEEGKSSRQLRKRSTRPVLADEMEDGTQENGDLHAETSNNSLMDEDDNGDDEDEYIEETNHRKRAPRKSNKVAVEKGKTVRRRKNASEGSDPLDKEPPKKKFSHSTRRNKRQVDKVLLETPEELINPRKLIIKDLILLAEAKERMLNKDAVASKKSIPAQSVSNSFAQDAPYDEDDPFASMRGLNPDDEEATVNPGDEETFAGVQQSSFKLNYHSFMDRTPKERWSKQDTELFFEAIRQFGTDFAMIQQLFPGRTRHQVKLKYKKEERQHPLKLSDALTNRSKDHSHFELVIERLQQAAAAQAEENVESMNVTGDEEVTPETNEEVSKSEWKDEDVVNDVEPEVPVVHSPVKSHDSEDDLHGWSQYKSDYDEY